MEESFKYCPNCSERPDIIGPEGLMQELGDKFFHNSLAPDWFFRKEAFEKLQKVLQAHQILKDGDYRPLMNHLRKVIITDLCVIVVGLAVQCVTSLAKKLGKHFSRYAEGMFQVLFEKFVEKRQKMTELLREAVDSIFDTTRLENLQFIITKLLKHNNPSIRYEVILFLARSFPKCKRRALSKPLFQPLFLSLKSLLSDGDIVIREKTLAAVGAAVQAAGEKAMLPYIKDLDLASKAKIEVYQMRAWEVAKTYNEMKFPNFRDRTRKPDIVECPLSLVACSQVSFTVKVESSKSEVTESISNRTVSLNGLPSSDGEKKCPEDLEHPACEHERTHLSNNTSAVTEASNTELENIKEIKKEPSLPGESCQNESGYVCINTIHTPEPEHDHISSNLNIDVKAEQLCSAAKTHQEESITSDESTNQTLVRQIADHYLANVTEHLKELTREHRLIAYNPPPSEITNEAQEQRTETNTTISTVLVDLEKELEESQVGFTKKELDELLYILNNARYRAGTRESLKSKRKTYFGKHHRFTTMSRGLLTAADHKETQCTSSASLVDKPTQTAKEEKPTSISCIVNCCQKCTRLLIGTTPRTSKYIFPFNTGHKNPIRKNDESSDTTVYRELISSERLHAKSESDLIKKTLAEESHPDVPEVNRDPRSSQAYEVKNFIALHNPRVLDKLQKLHNNLRGIEVIEKPRVCSNAQQTELERNSSSLYSEKRTNSKKSKVSTCNKTTFVTTTSQKKRKKRRKNRSTYASLQELTQANRTEKWTKREHCQTDSRRAMKVRVIRIE